MQPERKPKAGAQYERLARQVFDLIVNSDRPETIEVQHDARLEGRSATHQVDVYWVFQVGGIRYETVLEAKDTGRPVSKEKVLAFIKTLEDLPERPRGVFVTRTGYQDGARRVAEAYGIRLYTLDQIDTRSIDFSQTRFDITNHRVIFDTHWNVAEAMKNGAMTAEEIVVQLPRRAADVLLYNEAHEPMTDLYTVLMHLFPSTPEGYKDIAPTRREHIFPKPIFVKTDKPLLPWARIKGVRGIFSITTTPKPISSFPSVVLRDVAGGEVKMFSPDELGSSPRAWGPAPDPE